MNELNKPLYFLKKSLLFCSIIIAAFLSVIFSLHYIPVNSYSDSTEAEFYLMDNGQHIDIIFYEDSIYKAYGWGSKIFFTKVQEFEDLTIKTTVQSLFTEPASLMRVIEYRRRSSSWLKVNCTTAQYQILRQYVRDSYYDEKYNYRFHYAKGNYNALNTCNTWVNNGLKIAGLKAVVYALTSKPISRLYE